MHVDVTLPRSIEVCQYRRMSKSVIELVPPQSSDVCCAPLVSGELSLAGAELMAARFKALADPVRLRLFAKIASYGPDEACVCDIDDVGVSQPTVSHHLRKLREAGLVTSERRGTWVYYRVVPGVLASMSAVLAADPVD
jgi:ArsR family transcriptional regulator, arsenate/arsenite/antimonite-responsive transcriptional repressor